MRLSKKNQSKKILWKIVWRQSDSNLSIMPTYWLYLHVISIFIYIIIERVFRLSLSTYLSIHYFILILSTLLKSNRLYPLFYTSSFSSLMMYYSTSSIMSTLRAVQVATPYTLSNVKHLWLAIIHALPSPVVGSLRIFSYITRMNFCFFKNFLL